MTSFFVFGLNPVGCAVCTVLFVLLTLPYNKVVFEPIPSRHQTDMSGSQQLCHCVYRWLTSSTAHFVIDNAYGELNHERNIPSNPQIQEQSRINDLFQAVLYRFTSFKFSTDATARPTYASLHRPNATRSE